MYQDGAFWTADDNIQEASKATSDAGLSGVTAMSWFCNQGGGGVAGIAWVGTLCMGSGYNTNLNEAYSSQSVSGFVSSIVDRLLFNSLNITVNSTNEISF